MPILMRKNQITTLRICSYLNCASPVFLELKQNYSILEPERGAENSDTKLTQIYVALIIVLSILKL